MPCAACSPTASSAAPPPCRPSAPASAPTRRSPGCARSPPHSFRRCRRRSASPNTPTPSTCSAPSTNSARSRPRRPMDSFDRELRLPLPDDLSAETVAVLCDVLRDLADAVENRYADRLVAEQRTAANANATPTPNAVAPKPPRPSRRSTVLTGRPPRAAAQPAPADRRPLRSRTWGNSTGNARLSGGKQTGKPAVELRDRQQRCRAPTRNGDHAPVPESPGPERSMGRETPWPVQSKRSF